MIPAQIIAVLVAESVSVALREITKLTAFTQGGVVTPEPGLVGEASPEVIVPKDTECWRTDAGHGWGQCYTADDLGRWFPKDQPTIIVIDEGEK
jgi:hypothetical protein